MITKLWWQYIREHWIVALVIALVIALIVYTLVTQYLINGTGFFGYTKVTTTHTISRTNAGTTTITDEYQPGKTVWDWLNLLGILAVPIVIAVGGYWFNQIQKQREVSAATEREKLERQSREDNQHENALQTYLDKMSELLLHDNLSKSGENDEAQTLARVRTITVLPRLDGRRKRNVIHFLLESCLIGEGKSYLIERGADLSEADLSKFILSGVNLSQDNLSNAILTEADLSGAILREASFTGADLSGANLSGADFRGNDLLTGTLEDARSLKGTDLRGVKGLTKEQLESCKAKGAIIDEDPTTSSSQSTVSPPTLSQSNDIQAPLAPSAQGSTPPSHADGSSATSSKPSPES